MAELASDEAYKIMYAWENTVTIKSVFLLFDTSMMNPFEDY